ncbi:S-adenosyl-L-methionine-dependent methyltransferase [Pseudovirgaria hyperparasitica]|uniref:S-adenosyl-L-methionine-dependent methyltransferase n=1 Tax=Pseudovirgaria hyperparasitica TaxID=470096 RepID=A0A6A6WDL4_9PEZI|nr:S-adenosyl-L-methionine-dependent methyltransferase [Pseudovirgaria hyperparasitica]KAF2759647.1 S-adenosyl-L-methionine-dependent methyltransferase [Pseudovirgaria hyperparasitica]
MSAAVIQSSHSDDFKKPQSAPRDYAFVREWNDAVRLAQQHWIWSYIMDEKYPLHPAAQALVSADNPTREPVHIADVGCGNGTWLLDLYRKMPQTMCDKVFYVGTDLSSDYLPPTGDMPQNMTFSTLDLYGDMPADFIGKFDVVHIRMFAVVVKGNDPTSLLQNVVKMLKPGGILQWDEMAVASCRAIASINGVSTMASEEWIKALFEKFKISFDSSYEWILHLSEYFETVGLKIVDSVHMECPKELRRTMTSNIITASENLSRSMSRDESWIGKWSAMMAEVNQGVCMVQDTVMVVGQKPTIS